MSISVAIERVGSYFKVFFLYILLLRKPILTLCVCGAIQFQRPTNLIDPVTAKPVDRHRNGRVHKLLSSPISLVFLPRNHSICPLMAMMHRLSLSQDENTCVCVCTSSLKEEKKTSLEEVLMDVPLSGSKNRTEGGRTHSQ